MTWIPLLGLEGFLPLIVNAMANRSEDLVKLDCRSFFTDLLSHWGSKMNLVQISRVKSKHWTGQAPKCEANFLILLFWKDWNSKLL